MTLEDYLQDDEEIIAKIEQGNIGFYATNKKVMRYEKGEAGKVDMLFYPHIASVSITFHSWLGWIIAGVILCVLSFFWDDFLKPLGINDSELFTILMILTIIIAISLIAQGIYNYNRCSLNFLVAGFSTTDKMKWNIQRIKFGELKEFVKAIQRITTHMKIEEKEIMEEESKNEG